MHNPILALEGGATHTKAAVVLGGDASTVFEAGPCNPTAYGIAASQRALVEAGVAALAAWTGPRPCVAAIGSAGAVEPAQRAALGEAVCAQLGLDRAVVSTDLHPLLLANARAVAGILAIAGTGSNVLARGTDGRMVQVGGRGTLLGDDGSGYMIASEALRHAARAQDGWGPETTLTEALPRAAKLACFDDLITWGAKASKRDIAALVRAVLSCAQAGDAVARECVAREAALLADQVHAAARRLGNDAAALPCVYGVGGLFETYTLFVDCFNRRLTEQGSTLRYAPPHTTGPAAVAVLAELDPIPAWAMEVRRGAAPGLPGTESAAALTPLDTLSPADAVRRMLSAEAIVATCLARQESEIISLTEAAVGTLQSGGRILYFGAGTSGRLGVLDASECVPTFGVGDEAIAARIAGGDSALRHAVEGAEDDDAAGTAEVAALNAGPADIVVGIAASGATPYVRGALAAARVRGARTALICCTSGSDIPVDHLVALDTGAEALPGSTRLKAGTATKIVLNILSTVAMALSGRVYEGRMVAMRPSNGKLRARAVRMVSELADVSPDRATELIEATDYDIRAALLMALRGIDAPAARALLATHHGRLRDALEHRG